MKTIIKNISVIGLGKLGLPLAACLANKGYRVTGIDVNKRKVALINKKRIPFFEPGLKEALAEAQDRISFTADYKKAIENSDATFIVVPTPSGKDNNFSIKHILEACRQMAPMLKKKKGFHVIVITSTVTPGSIDTKIRPFLEKYSGKKCGVDFGLCYNPEFIALGSVIRDLYNPDFVLMGESDKRTGDAVSSIYRNFCDSEPTIVRMNFVNAELTKLLVNTFVTMKISYANMIEELCEKFAGADVDVVTSALGLDERIGPKYLKGGLGYGGPCFPRDNLALLYAARAVKVKAELAESTDRFNKNHLLRLVGLILSKLPKGGTVGILGLSYKPGTDVVENAQGLLLARELVKRNARVDVYDPISLLNAGKMLGRKTKFSSSAEECIKRSEVIVIATPWEEFKKISPYCFERTGRKQVLIDPWRILDAGKFGNIAEYIPMGIGPVWQKK